MNEARFKSDTFSTTINVSEPYSEAGPWVMPDSPQGKAFLARHPEYAASAVSHVTPKPRGALAGIAPLGAIVGGVLFLGYLGYWLTRDGRAGNWSGLWLVGVLVAIVVIFVVLPHVRRVE